MFPIDQNALADVPVQNQQIPKSGPLVVPITCKWDTYTTQRANLQNLQSRGRFGNCQTVFVDNSNSTQPVSIQTPAGQTLTVQAGRQGYYPLLVPNPIDISFSVPATAGGEFTKIHLINIPLAPFEWTGDENNVTPISVSANTRQTGNGDEDLPLIVADASGVTSGTTDADFAGFLTPPAGQRTFVGKLVLCLSPDAAFLSGGSWIFVVFQGSAAGMLRHVVMVPGQVLELSLSFLGATDETFDILIEDSAANTDELSAGILTVSADYADGLFV